MSDKTEVIHYTAREVIGVFPAPEALEAAVDELEKAGVDRSAISVLGTNTKRPNHLQNIYQSAKQIADDPAAQRAAFVSSDSRAEGAAMAVALPFTITGLGSAWAVAAAGGVLATAIGVTLVGGAVGAGVGLLLLRAVAKHHADNVHAQLARGGFVLWVNTPDTDAEQRALGILRRCGGLSVHTHQIAREWRTEDSPLHDGQPDPFLEREL
jgi:hypothetical protein